MSELDPVSSPTNVRQLSRNIEGYKKKFKSDQIDKDEFIECLTGDLLCYLERMEDKIEELGGWR